jgi:hypothetical protein
VIQASLLKELLKVLRGWPHLELATARDLHGMLHARAAYLLVDSTIIVGHGLLVALFAPLIAAHGSLHCILDGKVRWCSPATARGRAKLGHLGADVMSSGDAASFFRGAHGASVDA